MLDYLESLCQALAARDAHRIRLALRHPLARALPRSVRAEALAIARAGTQGQLAPVRTLHFYYQTVQLLVSVEPLAPDALFVQSAPRVRAQTLVTSDA